MFGSATFVRFRFRFGRTRKIPVRSFTMTWSQLEMQFTLVFFTHSFHKLSNVLNGQETNSAEASSQCLKLSLKRLLFEIHFNDFPTIESCLKNYNFRTSESVCGYNIQMIPYFCTPCVCVPPDSIHNQLWS